VSTLEDFAGEVARELERLEPALPVDLDSEPLKTVLTYERKRFVFESAAGSDHIFLNVTPGGPQQHLLPNHSGVNQAVTYIRSWAGLANEFS
jgi:hypothetical protein